MDIGARIKYFRTKSALEQKQLAELLNVSNKTVSSWERNRTEPRIEMIDKMCEIFGCRRSAFLGESDVDYLVRENDFEYLIECYNRASESDRKLIDTILYKYSDAYKKVLEDMTAYSHKIEESEGWHFDKDGNIVDKKENK